MTPRSLSGTLLGTPQEGEICQLFPPGEARSSTNNSFWPPGPPPGAIWSAPGASPGPHGAQKRPRRLQDLILDPPGALWGAFFFDFGCFFDHLRRSFLSGSVTCCCSFLRACSCSRFVFGAFEAYDFESWKPSIPEALGGRRGSRSDKN